MRGKIPGQISLGEAKEKGKLRSQVHCLRRQAGKCMQPKVCMEGWTPGDTERGDGRWQKRKDLLREI